MCVCVCEGEYLSLRCTFDRTVLLFVVGEKIKFRGRKKINIIRRRATCLNNKVHEYIHKTPEMKSYHHRSNQNVACTFRSAPWAVPDCRKI